MLQWTTWDKTNKEFGLTKWALLNVLFPQSEIKTNPNNPRKTPTPCLKATNIY